MERYEIRLSGLKTGRHTFQFELDKKFFEFFEQNGFGEDLIQDGNLTADVILDKRETMLEFEFSIQGTVKVPCDTCMNPMDVPLELNQRVIGKFTDEPSWHEDELIHISSAAHKYDVSQLLYEFVHLGLPLKNVHEEEDCDPEMVKKIKELKYGEGDEEESTDPRWNALKSLKRK